MKRGDKVLSNINDNLEQFLNNFIGKVTIINQSGFVESKYSFGKFKFFIE